VTWSSNRFEAETDAGIFAYERSGGDAGDSYALVVFNVHRDHESTPIFDSMPMTVTQPDGSELVDAISGDSYTVGSGGTLAITLPPLSVAILVPRAQYVSSP